MSVAEMLAHVAVNTWWPMQVHKVDNVSRIESATFMTYMKSRLEMLLGAKEHEMHHRAQLMLIERLLGIVPHLTRNRQAAAR